MKNFLALASFIFVILLIGRNLTFLPKFNLALEQKTQAEELKPKILEFVSKQKGSYSIYYSDLNSNDSFGINENQMYTGASVNKLPIIAALYYLANKGNINIDEKIVIQKEDIQDYGTGKLRYEEPGSAYSLKTLAKLSLKESDNTASYIIVTKIGMEKIQQLMESFGLTQTDMANNKTTAYDIFILFKKIYKGEITNSKTTKELLGFMTDTETEDRLPSLLDKNTIVYHKTGDAIGSIHDLGIIKKGDILFFLGIMTSDVGNKESKTKESIGEIAKKILDFKVGRKN